MLHFILLFPFYLCLEMHQNAPCGEYIVGVGIRIHIGVGITQIKKEKEKKGGGEGGEDNCTLMVLEGSSISTTKNI